MPDFSAPLYSKVGKFTKEEFEIAKKRHLSDGVPRLFLFQNTYLPKDISDKDFRSRSAFLKMLKAEDHFPILFPSTSELLREVAKSRLSKLLKEGFFVGKRR